MKEGWARYRPTGARIVIVLRLIVKGHRRDVRSPSARVLLGCGPEADVQETDAGWHPAEAVIHHRGTEVLLERPTAGGTLRLRVGDDVRLGRARVMLIGLLPLEEAEAAEPVPVFGGYEDELPASTGAFRLADESSAPAPETTPTPPRPAPPPSAAAAPKPDPAPPPKTSPRPSAPRQTPPPPPRTGEGTPGTTKPGKGTLPPPRPPTPAFRPPTFGQELFSQLKRAPFFFLSVAVHALVFLILAFLQSKDPGSQAGEGGGLFASLHAPAPQQRWAEQDADDDTGIPVPEMPDLPEPELPPDDVGTEQERDSDGMTLSPLDTPEDVPLHVGLNPSLSSARARTGEERTKVSDAEMQKPFAGADARGANQRAADYVRAQFGRGTGRTGNPLDRVVRGDLLVVEGSFDKIGEVLHALRLPYLAVTPLSLTLKDTPALSTHRVIFWNCGESLPPSRLSIASRRIRKFVEDGGFLFTTDWGVGNLLAMAFPGYLGTKGAVAPLPEIVVGIRPAKGKANHPLLEGVFPRGIKGQWWLEQSSFDVRVLNKSEVTVLIESLDLEQKLNRSPVVAVTFPYGKGRVLHLAGHYYQEMGNIAGTISAHRLALNFVLMSLRQRRP